MYIAPHHHLIGAIVDFIGSREMSFVAFGPEDGGEISDYRAKNASKLNQARTEYKAGDLCTVKRDGKDWPVVICDEATVRQFFEGERSLTLANLSYFSEIWNGQSSSSLARVPKHLNHSCQSVNTLAEQSLRCC